MTQSRIAATLSKISTTSVSAIAECRDNVLRIICHKFFVPCGRNGTIYLPTSICQEECLYVRDTCQTFWNQTFEAIESELGRVNCETPGSALSPLPTCCTGAGVSIPTTSECYWLQVYTICTITDFKYTQYVQFTDCQVYTICTFTDFKYTQYVQSLTYKYIIVAICTIDWLQVYIMCILLCSHANNLHTPSNFFSSSSGSIIGGGMGGALILVILLLILVVIIAVVVDERRKKAAVQSFQLEVLAR